MTPTKLLSGCTFFLIMLITLNPMYVYCSEERLSMQTENEMYPNDDQVNIKEDSTLCGYGEWSEWNLACPKDWRCAMTKKTRVQKLLTSQDDTCEELKVQKRDCFDECITSFKFSKGLHVDRKPDNTEIDIFNPKILQYGYGSLKMCDCTDYGYVDNKDTICVTCTSGESCDRSRDIVPKKRTPVEIMFQGRRVCTCLFTPRGGFKPGVCDVASYYDNYTL